MSNNLEVALTLKASVDQFAAAIKQATDGFASAMQGMGGAAEQAGNKVDSALGLMGMRRHADIEADIRKIEHAYQDMARSGQLSARELAQAQLRAQERIRELRAETNGWADALGKVKVEVAAAGAALYGMGHTLVAASRESAGFQTALAEISTLLDDVGDMPALRRGIEQLSLEFGGDVQANSKALYDIISAGAEDATRAVETLRAANELAIGGVSDVSTAADGLTSVLNAYGEAAGNASTVSDAFFAAVKAGKTTVAELAGGIGQVAPLAYEAGVSLDELLASVATLTKGGVGTSEAMTQVRGALAGIIKPSGEAAALAESLGLEFSAIALKSKGFAEFLADVARATGGNVEKMSTLFGSVEALGAVLALTGKGADDFGDILVAMGDKAGSTEQAVSKMMDAPAARAARLKQSMAAVERSFGDALTALSPLLDGLTGLLNRFNSLDPGVRAVAAGSVGLVASLAVVAGAVKSLSAAVGILRTALVMTTAARVADTAATTAHTAAATANAAAIKGQIAAFGRLGGALAMLWAAWEGGQALGGYLKDQFLEVELAGIALAGGLTKAAVAAKFAFSALKSPLNAAEAFAEYQQKLRDIDAEYADLAQAAIEAGNKSVQGAGDTKSALEKAGEAGRQAGADTRSGAEAAATGLSAGTTAAERLAVALSGASVDSEKLKTSLTKIDIATPQGLFALIDGLALAGKSAADIGTELSVVMEKLDGQQLAQFAAQLQSAFQGGALSAADFARLNDQVLGESFRRLGLTAETELGRISPSARDAIAAVDALGPAIAATAAAVEQKSQAMENALRAAFGRADTTAAVEALKARVERLRQEGTLTEQAYKRLGDIAKNAFAGAADSKIREAQMLDQLRQRVSSTAAEYHRLREAGAPQPQQQQALMQWSDAQRDLTENTQGAADAQENLKDKGDKTASAAQQQAEKMGEITSEMQRLNGSADDAGDSIQEMGEQSERAGEQTEQAGQAASSAVSGFDEFAAGAQQSIAAVNQALATQIQGAIQGATGGADGLRRALNQIDGSGMGKAADEAARLTAQAEAAEQAAREVARAGMYDPGLGAQDFFGGYLGRLKELEAQALRSATAQIRALRALDDEASRLRSSTAEQNEDLRLQIMELDATEEEMAAARRKRALAQIQLEIKLQEIELRKASLSGDSAAVEIAR
ncbi:MAG: phage tail tape measure protein, partial [Halothiobacillaceae bacterium]|nr:phage tail tape measure protein [Halothiobacillaceae bacterium]